MALTRKHFVMIASAVRTARELHIYQLNRDPFEVVADILAVHLRKENPAFDIEKFLDACRGETT
jgi:hypothetical protein